jgi:hypothetical protein
MKQNQKASGWSALGFVLGGCLGGTQAQPVTPEGLLAQAKANAAEARWPEARTAAVAYWVARCKNVIENVTDCANAELVRGDAELATESPETALLAFDWVLKNGDVAAKERAHEGAQRAKEPLQRLLDAQSDSSWLVIEEDFDDNHKFGPERAAYTLDGAPLGEVTRRSTFAEREHRVVAKAVPPGHHQLAVEIHWKGQGTFDSYLWSSFTPIELDTAAASATVATLNVSYNDGGPSNNSVQQVFEIVKLP